MGYFRSLRRYINSRVSHFDADFYRLYYPDMLGVSSEDATHDYWKRGYREGRFPNSQQMMRRLRREYGKLPRDFGAEEYLKLNHDLGASTAWQAAAHYLLHGRQQNRPYRTSQPLADATPISSATRTITQLDLHRQTSHIFDMPHVIVDASAAPRINVLVPTFDFKSMSAGFFGVFEVALFIRRLGYRVRLVMHDAFAFNKEEMRRNLKNYPGMEQLLDLCEVIYIGDRKTPLVVSGQDNCVATVWYSAYLADKIMRAQDDRPFLYLVQDYESGFYPQGALWLFAEASYALNFAALVSTQSLLEFFKERVAPFRQGTVNSIFFDNACSARLPSRVEFFNSRKSNRKSRFVFYSRPQVDRNAFQLGALALSRAIAAGHLDPENWEFFGIGLGDFDLDLGNGAVAKQLPRMHLREYQQMVSTFDMGLCLMASPHPSLLPFDLAGSGCVTVTNTFATKTRRYFDQFSAGIIGAEPTLDGIVAGLAEGSTRVAHLEERYTNAKAMSFPRAWIDTWKDEHSEFIIRTFRDTPRVAVGSRTSKASMPYNISESLGIGSSE